MIVSSSVSPLPRVRLPSNSRIRTSYTQSTQLTRTKGLRLGTTTDAALARAVCTKELSR